MKTINERTTEYEIDNRFLERHSPRAMSGEAISKIISEGKFSS